MNRVVCLPLILLVVAAGAPAQSGKERPELTPPVPRAFTMGFVDMERLIREHPATRAKTDQFDKEFRDKLEKLKLQVDEMNSIRDAMDIFAEGSPEHLAQMKRLRKLDATLELEQKLIRVEFQLKVVEALKDVYQRCRKVVSEVAKERNLSAIAMVSSSEVRGRTRSELVGDILTRPFVFHDESLDVTREVLRRLGVDPDEKDEPKKADPKDGK